MTDAGRDPDLTARLRVPGAAFLLSQLGSHSSRLWKQRLSTIGVDPRQVLLLRHVAAAEGQSQQALGEALRIPPSRMVALVDELEKSRLLERRANPDDRRARALHLTQEGRQLLDKVMNLSAEHEAQLSTGLTAGEHAQLVSLLKALVAAQDIPEGVHPGFAAGRTDDTNDSAVRGSA
jgi:DNA-binding MarR family transcriptional regulator